MTLWQDIRYRFRMLAASRAICSENVSESRVMFGSRNFLNRYLKPQSLKLSDMTADGPLRVTPVEVVGAELLVGDTVAHEVERDFENLMPDGDHGFHMSPMPFDPVLRLKGRALLAHGPQARLNERGA
jgi:hypothetical protein